MRIVVPVLLVAALTGGPALAQYRDAPAAAPGQYRDGPDVLTPRPAPPPPGAAAAAGFRAAYARVGRPRMMIFWNRSFSDEVSSGYRDTLHAETSAHSDAAGAVVATPYGYGSAAEANSRGTLDISTGAQRVDQGRASPLDENVDFAVEAAFSEALAANGAQLIDRSLAMRTAHGARGAGSRPNQQQIETDAATGRADLLIEVLQTSASNTPTGALFKVTVKDIRRARLLAAFTTGGNAPARRPGLVPGPGGFVRAAAETTGPAGVGRELASRTMSALAGSLR